MKTTQLHSSCPMSARATFRPARTALGLIAVLFVSASGCGGHGVMKLEGNNMSAGGMVVQALDAWKEGRTSKDLMQDNPRIVMVDVDWQQGSKLVSFGIDGDPIENGSHWRVFANIKTEDKEKKEKTERVCYAVEIHPEQPVSIVRSDFLN